VKPIKDACPLNTRKVVPIADAAAPSQGALAAGAPFADGNSVEIGCLDKSKAIYASRHAAEGVAAYAAKKINRRW
jgi:hypothetical protein